MAKKAKGKGKKGKKKDKGPVIPAEWAGKSVEELQTLVAELESQLANSRKSRNKAQAEHASIQSYYDATQEQIRELDMKIERKNLEIENTLEDNATELRVYEQKANFIKYCHDSRLRDESVDNEQKRKASAASHDKRVQDIEISKMDMRETLAKTEEQHAKEISGMQEDGKADLTALKGKLDADVKLFEQKCQEQHTELRRELDLRREAQLKIVESRKESRLKDLAESHRHRCEEMRTYFEGMERQQQIDIEDLEAEIRRLKKAALQNEANRDRLKESNDTCGEELRRCSESVGVLESKTKDMEKDTASLRSTNARLSTTRRTIQEAMAKYERLKQKYNAVEEERNLLRDGIDRAKNEACKRDVIKQGLLDGKLKELNEQNVVLEQHLDHISSSAGLDAKKTEMLQSNLHEFIQQNSEEMEKLHLSVARAAESYNKALRACRSELLGCGFSEADAESINALEQ